MLYVTTRSDGDAYTAHRVLERDRGPDGGLFIPLRLPAPEDGLWPRLRALPSPQAAAEVLNLFFSAGLTPRDAEAALGPGPYTVCSLSHRVLIAELWRSCGGDFSNAVQKLTSAISGRDTPQGVPGSWTRIAIRIAVLFALFGELARAGQLEADDLLDVAVPAGDFSVPMAVWYARSMGLPVANILCVCGDDGGVWDLLHHGELHMDGAGKTAALPDNLERLIRAVLGREETLRFCRHMGRTYSLPEANRTLLCDGLSAAVVGSQRLETVRRTVYRSSGLLLDSGAALAYAGLQDHRAGAGESRNALLLSDRDPLLENGGAFEKDLKIRPGKE